MTAIDKKECYFWTDSWVHVNETTSLWERAEKHPSIEMREEGSSERDKRGEYDIYMIIHLKDDDWILDILFSIK